MKESVRWDRNLTFYNEKEENWKELFDIVTFHDLGDIKLSKVDMFINIFQTEDKTIKYYIKMDIRKLTLKPLQWPQM